MKHKTLRGLQLLLGLLLFAAGSGQTGGIGLVVQQIEAVGARQWLSLMAGSIVSSTPLVTPMSQRIARVFHSRPVPSAAEEIAGGQRPGDLNPPVNLVEQQSAAPPRHQELILRGA